ncbi:MAG: cls [Sphingomonadales bacterium]|nr:cls [Sphingomonadales bacterium]
MFVRIFPDLGTGYLVLEWIIRIGMTLVVPFRRSPGATRSWLLLIYFLPVPGALFYAAIGRPRFPKWRAERFANLADFYDRLRATLEPAGKIDGYEESAALVRRVGGMPKVAGNAVELIDCYDAVMDRLVVDIDAARHHVRILVYLFANDVTGTKVIDALGRAKRRGVECHVLIDPVGSHKWLKGTRAALQAVGVETREALPFRLLRGRTRRDMRNHRKLFLIDGVVGYAGSQNIVDKDFRAGVTNHELVARVTGPVVAEMTGAFLADWYLETEVILEEHIPLPASDGDVTAQLLPSGADYKCEGFQTFLVWKIHRAEKHILITTPYLIPDEDLLSAMRTAVLRGVVVDLVVSAIADQKLVNMAQRSYYQELIDAGVRIHRFRNFLLHAKNVSIDGSVAIIGSSNVDIRSFQLNEEVSLVLYGADAVAPLEAIQRGYLAASDPVDAVQWRKRSGLEKVGENIARMVSPLL